MTRISVHLYFNGQCELAFKTYERILGGKITTLLTYAESPLAEQCGPELGDRIIHANLELDGQTLLGADLGPEHDEGHKGFSVALGSYDVQHARELFEALAEGGQIKMPFQATFWSPGFGALIDRFGISWEINTETQVVGQE